MNDELRALLNRQPVMFWVCPLGHSDRSRFPSGRPETVHWTHNTAHCTYPGCTATSESPVDSVDKAMG